MKGLTTLMIISVLLALLPTGPTLAQDRMNAQDEQAIEEQLWEYETRFNEGDAAGVAELFAEDVVYYDPLGRVHEGRDAVQQLYQGNLDAGFTEMSIELIEIEVLNDTAYDIARYTITTVEGETFEGYHLAILARENGEWRVQRTVVNTVVPEPEMNDGAN